MVHNDQSPGHTCPRYKKTVQCQCTCWKSEQLQQWEFGNEKDESKAAS